MLIKIIGLSTLFVLCQFEEFNSYFFCQGVHFFLMIAFAFQKHDEVADQKNQAEDG